MTTLHFYKRPRFQFHMGRVHVPPNRDWSLYLTLWGFQLEINIALTPKDASGRKESKKQ